MRIPSVCSKSWFLMGILFVVSFGVGLFFYREFYRPVLDDPFVMEREVQRSIPPWIEIKNVSGKTELIDLKNNIKYFLNTKFEEIKIENIKENSFSLKINPDVNIYVYVSKSSEKLENYVKNTIEKNNTVTETEEIILEKNLDYIVTGQKNSPWPHYYTFYKKINSKNLFIQLSSYNKNILENLIKDF